MDKAFLIILSVLWVILLLLFIIKNRQQKIYFNNSIKKLNKLPTDKYFCLFIDVGNLYKYSQFYDVTIGNSILSVIYSDLQDRFGKKNVFLYATNQIVVILPFTQCEDYDIRHKEQYQAAESIIDCIENKKYFLSNSQYYSATIVVGTGSVGKIFKENKIEEIVKLAYFAMIKAKERGIKILTADEQLRIIKKDYDSFYKEIEKGFELDQFSPFFMPIVNPFNMRIEGCESLVRWRKDKYRIIETSKFYEIALERNLFEKIDMRVMEKTFQSFLCWKKFNLINDNFFIALNLTQKTINKLDIQTFIEFIKEYALKPENIEFDISFDNDITSDEIDKVINLKKAGFKIAYDEKDHNISFRLLNEVHFDKMKIKCSIINRQDRILNTIMDLSNHFNYKVLAKSVESKEHFNVIKDLNIHYAEGYYFTKPVDAEIFEQFLFKYKNGIK